MMHVLTFTEFETRIDEIADAAISSNPDGLPPAEAAGELLSIGESVMERWIIARGETPTREKKEGFRILALHRQGARGDPSFNACRETCRELVYHYNLVTQEPLHQDGAKRVRLAALVAKHLVLFVGGKLENAGLGEFCCSAKPLRMDETSKPLA